MVISFLFVDKLDLQLSVCFLYFSIQIAKMITQKIKQPQNAKSRKSAIIENNGILGKEIKVSPKSLISLNQKGFSIEFYVPTVEVLIGIGNNYTAYLIMEEDGWKALNKGAKVDITTLKEFKDKFINPIKKKK